MRFIGSISDNAAATRFADYLTSIGVANTVEQGSAGFSIWVHDDDEIERARGELEAFNSDPAAAKYAAATARAREIERVQEKRQASLRRNFVDVRTSFAGLRNKPMPVTVALILICSGVAAVTNFGMGEESGIQDWLYFGRISESEMQRQMQRRATDQWRQLFGQPRARRDHRFKLLQPGLEDILHGQVWRLWTPMFLHFGIMHFAFNMLWLFELGSAIERSRGPLVLLGLVLITDLVGSVAQFYWAGPYFGGMSGVVYGLFGYVWVKSIVQPQLGLRIGNNTIAIMMIWLVACMLGLIPNVANAGHVGGLLAGLLLAHGPYSWQKMRRAMAARSKGY